MFRLFFFIFYFVFCFSFALVSFCFCLFGHFPCFKCSKLMVAFKLDAENAKGMSSFWIIIFFLLCFAFFLFLLDLSFARILCILKTWFRLYCHCICSGVHWQHKGESVAIPTSIIYICSMYLIFIYMYTINAYTYKLHSNRTLGFIFKHFFISKNILCSAHISIAIIYYIDIFENEWKKHIMYATTIHKR